MCVYVYVGIYAPVCAYAHACFLILACIYVYRTSIKSLFQPLSHSSCAKRLRLYISIKISNMSVF